MADRNLALAATVPDGDRDSWVRIRANNHPLSSDLDRLAMAVRQQSEEIADALANGNGARVLQLLEALKSKQRLLAAQLERHAATARSHEDMLVARLEARHGS